MNKLVPALFGILMGALVGGVVMWFVVGVEEPPRPEMEQAAEVNDEDDTEPGTIDGTDEEEGEDELPSIDKEFNKLVRENSRLKKELNDLEEDNQNLETEVERLNTRVAELEGNDDPAVETTPGEKAKLPISFGKWGDMQELSDADWKTLGETIQTMHGMMKEVREAIASGKPMDPALQQKLGAENRKLVNHYIKVMGKLPTNFERNGEFTHPVNLANFLAGQLEAAGDPLSEQQLADIAKLGEEYERKWTELQDSYDENTYALKKLLDEAELKEWFKAEMFRVTTPQQKHAALPPHVEGILGLDLYSSGLNFQGGVDPVTSSDTMQLKDDLKSHIEQYLSVERATLDNAEYIFDDWIATLTPQLQPKTQQEANVIHVHDVINAGKIQLSSMIQFAQGYVTDEKKKESIRAIETVLLPQIVNEE